MKAAIAFSTVALATALAASAAEPQKPAETYIYATYFYCDTSQEDKADELADKYLVPVYDAAVADGTITGWGWLAHHTGGQWRRILYHTSNSVEGLLAGEQAIVARATKAGPPDNGLRKVCSTHDDYIWKQEASSKHQGARGPAQLSVYEVCSMTGGERAAEIAKTTFAPLLDKAVADGKLMSWSWNSHVLGGQYRTLQTMTAKDNASLLAARADIIKRLYEGGDKAVTAAANEYDSICTSHTDYLWMIRHEKG